MLYFHFLTPYKYLSLTSQMLLFQTHTQQTYLPQFRVPVISQKKTCNFRKKTLSFSESQYSATFSTYTCVSYIKHAHHNNKKMANTIIIFYDKSPFRSHLCKSVRRKACRETLFGRLSFAGMGIKNRKVSWKVGAWGQRWPPEAIAEAF